MPRIDAIKEYEIYKKIIAQNKLAKEKKKDDPLSKYPLRLCAYSNEIGAAISPINPAVGNLLWTPALLYLGADIYDKYKNEDKTYNPSARRSLRQAVFQGLTSVLLPTVAIKIGQNVGVHVAGEKGALSATDKKELIEFTIDYLNNSDYPRTDNSELTLDLVNAFKQRTTENAKRIEKKSLFSKIMSYFSEAKGPESTMTKYLRNKTDENPVIAYLKEQAETAKEIMTNETAIKSDKYKQYFSKAYIRFEDPSVARKDTVLKLLKDKNINKSLVATISGLISLLIFAKPIDFFVENILMEKIVNPIIDKVPSKKQKQTEIKN